MDLNHNCTNCGLYHTRTNYVAGRGNLSADIMIIGEAPGEQEDLTGIPFVGPAGKLLDAMLASIGLGEDNCYITNVVKCRPPNNRKPTPIEVKACSVELDKEKAEVNPKIIISFGATSANAIINESNKVIPLSSLREQYWLLNNNIQGMATYHPSYLLRNPDAKDLAWSDLLGFKRLIDKLDLLK